MRASRIALWLPALTLAFAATAQATPVNLNVDYIETGVGSGILDGTSFTNAQVTLEGFSETIIAGVTNILFWGGKVIVAGVGEDGLPRGLFSVFDDQSLDTFGFSTLTGLPILTVTNPALASYELTTSIGPLTGPGGGTPEVVFQTTSGGGFEFTTIPSVVTFFASVPEPPSVALLGIGLLGLGLLGYRAHP